jgi:hypothetical protein
MSIKYIPVFNKLLPADGFRQCTDCGALVGNQAQHTLWHNDLVKAFETILKVIGQE